MPSVAAHMICAKLVAEELKISDVEFVKGNLLPDIIDIPAEKSHLKIKGKYYEIPDIHMFKRKVDFKNNLELGYFCHLLLDKYFLEDYIYDIINGAEVFLNGKIYEEYDIINYKLLTKFEINVEYLNKILKDFNVLVNSEKYTKNIQSLNNKDINKNQRYLTLESFSNFLIDASKNIAKQIRNVKK